MKDKTHFVLLCLILLVGGILLFSNLDLYDIWGDEVLTFPKGNNFAEVLKFSKYVPSQVHPPLYNFLQFMWSKWIAGKTLSGNRFLYALFAFVSLILIYQLGKELFNKKVGLIAGLLCATSPFLIQYSRMIRYYSLTVFLVLLTLLFFVRFRRSGRWKDWGLFTLSGLLLAYEDYLGWAILLVLYMDLILHWKLTKQNLLKWVLAAVVIFCLFSPWMPVLYSQVGRESNPYPELAQKAVEESPRMAQKHIGIRGVVFDSALKLGFLGYVFSLGETTFPWRWAISIPVIGSMLLLIFIVLLRMRAAGERNLRWLVFLAVSSLVILLILSEIYGVFSSRLFLFPSKAMFLLPLFLLVIAAGWDYLHSRALKAVLVVIIIGGNVYGLNNYFSGEQFLNQKYLVSFKKISEDISSAARPQDLVLNDEEAFIYKPMKDGRQIEKYGFVGAMQKVEQTLDERGPYRVFLVIRYRGDEQITLEGLNIREEMKARYKMVDTWNYVPTYREAAPYWKKFLGRDIPEYLVQVFVFSVGDETQEHS